MNTEQTSVRAESDADRTLTPVPFSAEEAEAAGWLSAEPKRYALATPLYGMAGEVATHIVASSVPAGTGPYPDPYDEVAVYAVDEHGAPFFLAPPLVVATETLDVDAVLASIGFNVKEA